MSVWEGVPHAAIAAVILLLCVSVCLVSVVLLFIINSSGSIEQYVRCNSSIAGYSIIPITMPISPGRDKCVY